MKHSSKSLFIAVAAVALSTSSLSAQKCAMPDTTKQWAKDQRAWLDDSKHAWTNDTLRTSVMMAAGFDPARTVPLQFGWTTLELPARDSVKASFLRPMMVGRGGIFPTKGVVGAGGAHAAFMLLLRDSTLESRGMHRFMEAGLGEGFETETAMLEDRTRVRAGRGQLYGTVLKPGADGKLVPWRIEDSAHVELRRETAWLPPLKQSVCAAAAGITSR